MATRKQKRAENLGTPGANLFLGAVVAKPTADEEAPIAAEFSLLLARVTKLLEYYNSGEIAAQQLAELLSRERVIDTDDGEWTVGASTGVWYHRRPGLAWTQVPPPGPGVHAKELLAVQVHGPDVTPEDDHSSVPNAPKPPMFFPGDMRTALPETFGKEDFSADANWVTGVPAKDNLNEFHRIVEDHTPAPPTPPAPAIPADAGDAYTLIGGSVSIPAPDFTADETYDKVSGFDDDGEEDTDELLRRWLDNDS